MLVKPHYSMLRGLAPLARQHPRAQGLVGWWLFGEGAGAVAYDLSRHANHGTLTNMPLSTAWVTGRRGTALDFDGSNDYVHVAAQTAYKPAQITVSAWVRPSGVTAYQQVVTLPYRTSGWTAPYATYGMWRNDTTAATMYHIAVGGTEFESASGSGTEWATGVWSHIVLTYDGEALRGYANGVLQVTNTSPSGALDYTGGTTDLVFGVRSSSSTGEFHLGALDDVRIYNWALPAGAVSSLYTQPLLEYAWALRQMRRDVGRVVGLAGDEGALWYLSVETA